MTCWCGEEAFSHDKHRRRGEEPCEGARLAHNAYYRSYYRRHAVKLAARKRELRQEYLIPEVDPL